MRRRRGLRAEARRFATENVSRDPPGKYFRWGGGGVVNGKKRRREKFEYTGTPAGFVLFDRVFVRARVCEHPSPIPPNYVSNI